MMQIQMLQNQTITHAPGIAMEPGGTQTADTQTSMVHGEVPHGKMLTLDLLELAATNS